MILQRPAVVGCILPGIFVALVIALCPNEGGDHEEDEMAEKKNKVPGALKTPTSNKRRKILADLHSGMVLLARFAKQPESARDRDKSGSQRSHEVRRVLKAEQPSSKHRWN